MEVLKKLKKEDINKFDFTRPELEYIKENANFNDEQMSIFEMLTHRTGRKSIIYISMQMNMSESTTKRRIKEIKKKILRII